MLAAGLGLGLVVGIGVFGFTSTLVGSGTNGTDSAAGTDTSLNLVNDGDSDMTLDFGFYPIAVSVGDYVWFDLNADGIQDSTESGIAGVTLSITKADGSPVTDVVRYPMASSSRPTLRGPDASHTTAQSSTCERSDA